MAKKGEEKIKEVQETKEEVFKLPTGKVHVKPILRSGRWLPDGHSGSFMYDHTSIGIQVPLNKDTGKLLNPLTKAEQTFFESKAGLDLEPGDMNPYKRKDNYWQDFTVFVRKSDSIVTDKTILMTINLSDPLQYLQYKVLMLNTKPDGGIVAPNWESRFLSGTYRVAVVHEGEQNKEKTRKADLMQEAYRYFGKIDNSEEEMFDFLTVYYLEKAKSKRPSTDWDKGTYKAEIQDLFDNDLKGVVELIRDMDNYQYKLMVHRGLKINALRIMNNRIETADGVPLGNSLKQAVQWLKDSRNQDEYLRLKNQIELSE
jgi:hypothetical protein